VGAGPAARPWHARAARPQRPIQVGDGGQQDAQQSDLGAHQLSEHLGSKTDQCRWRRPQPPEQLGRAAAAAVGVGGSPLVSPWQAAKLERIAKGEFSAQFALTLALKDVRLALQAADNDHFAALACLADEWQQAVDQGLGDQDLTVVTRVLEQHGGMP